MTIDDEATTHPSLGSLDDNSNPQILPRGSNLGRYVIIEPIGSGGMGTVYRAYDPQLNRGVALKILSVKHADLQVTERAKARLIREAQALAQLSHPNVVAVHDVGTFDEDVFIAMELVEGKTLSEWMKQEKRTIKEILDVMIAAGRGLSAAHKAGLVHRDFKPGNVIVGDDGRVRVLDFGLARVVDKQEIPEDRPDGCESDGQSRNTKNPIDWQEISSDSSHNLLQFPLTLAGGILGTPMYMAPEQHFGQKTDERTDQFGFCVVLYEVLYKIRPFAAKSILELRRKVTRELVCVQKGNTDVPAWLWQIVRKGLSAKPTDRYPSMELLLEDLDRDPEEEHLQRRLARRRNLIAFALVLLTIILTIGVWYGLRYRTVQLCKSAEDKLVGVWDEATKASVKSAFLGTKKSFAQGAWERVTRIVDNYVDDWIQMRSEVCEARLIRGTQSEELFDLRMSCLQKLIGELRALGNVFSKADSEVVEKAVQASASLTDIAICADEEALHAPYPPPKTEAAKAKVASIREKLTNVVPLYQTGKYQKALELVRLLDKETNTLDYLPVHAEVLYQLGRVLEKIGDYEQAGIALHDAAKKAGESKDALLAAKAMNRLVYVVGYHQARYEASLLIAQDVEILLGLANNDEFVLASLLGSLGTVYSVKGDNDQALANYRRSLAIWTKLVGPDHPHVATTINNLGVVYYDMGEYDQALTYWDRSMKMQEKILGPQHPNVAMLLNNMGGVLNLKGEYDKALNYHQRALAIRMNVFGPKHADVAMSLNNIGGVFFEQGDYNKALDYNRKALVIWEKVLGPEHPFVARTLHYLGSVYSSLGKIDSSIRYYQKALAILEKALGSEHPSLAEPLSRIGEAFLDVGMLNKSLKTFERVVSLCKKTSCQPGSYGQGLLGLARVLALTGKDKNHAVNLAQQARELFEKNSDVYKKELGKTNAWLQEHRTKRCD